jgi:hypothetical protein
MAYITGSVTDSLGTLPFSLLAGTQLTMSIQNALVGASYYGLETFPNQNGLYTPATPKNLSGSFILGPGIVDIVYDDYKMVAIVRPGGGTLTYTPAVNISASTLATRGTGANLGRGDFATLLANGFSTRVTRDGGIIEDSDAIINAINSQPILQNASYLLVPSGYKAGTLYSELSTNDYSDLTWVRASSGSRLNSLGNTENMGFNIPRLDYTYGTDPSVLLEPQRTNLVYSSSIAETQTRTVTAVSHSLSFYGTGSVTLSGVATGTLIGTGMNNRVSLTFRPTAGNLTLTVAGTVINWQLEAGAYATTHILTTNTSASRLADTGSLNNIYNNGLINSNGGTWYVELNNNRQYIRDNGTFPLFISNMTASGGTSTSLEFRNATAGSLSRLALIVRTGSSVPLSPVTTTDNLKAAFRWNGSNVTVFVTGSNAGSVAFNVTNMPFLRVVGTDIPIYIKTMALFSDPLSDADCIALTTL